ncbi:MAG: sensor histidine kinase [Pseudobdellovibrionaceae bacterium]
MQNSISFLELREKEVLKEFKEVLRVIAHSMAIPLFLIFWGSDLIYVPEKKWIFLALRLAIIPICLFTSSAIHKTQTAKDAQLIAAFYAVALASVINFMIALIGDPGTLYYAGLNLITIGCLSFLPVSLFCYFITALGIYLPYYTIVLVKASTTTQFSGITINSFFIVGTLTICFLIRYFHEKSRTAEIKTRMHLNEQAAQLTQALRDLHQTQSELVESARMASIGTLSSGVAHEINNAMNFVHQSIPLLKAHLQRLNDPEDSFEILEILQEGVERSVDIVKALRTQTGAGSHAVKMFSIKDSVTATISLLSKKLRDKGVEISNEIPASEDVNSYPGILAQTLTNLISNAIDASPPKKGNIRIKFQITPEAICFSVIDNGSGMSEETQSRIFDPFYTTKGPQHGSGLGLYIVKKNLNHIKGDITCKSKIGGPTEFNVRLPIEPLTKKEEKVA